MTLEQLLQAIRDYAAAGAVKTMFIVVDEEGVTMHTNMGEDVAERFQDLMDKALDEASATEDQPEGRARMDIPGQVPHPIRIWKNGAY